MPSPADPTAIAFLGLDVRWYAIFMLLGVIAGMSLTRFLAGRLGLDPDWVLNVAPWIVLASILGARLYYVTLRVDYFSTHPLEAVNIRLGGLSFHGALIAGLATLIALCHFRGRPVLRWIDVAVPGLALAQAVGRWGNWANQEAFGTPTDLPWGLAIDQAHRPWAFLSSERFHPTFLYESLFNLANALLLSWLALRVPRSQALRHGDVLAIYLINYGVARFLIERVRTDSLYLGPLPAAFWMSWVLLAAGVALLALPRIVHHSPGRTPA